MEQYIPKAALVAEIERRKKYYENIQIIKPVYESNIEDFNELLSFIDTLEVIDPYEQWIQYSSIEEGIKAHAEEYSFNIESELFNQLTKEQQALWRKEIEEACISGGYAGYQLAKDLRYKENLEVKEVDLEKEIDREIETRWRGEYLFTSKFRESAKHFFELGLKAKGE